MLTADPPANALTNYQLTDQPTTNRPTDQVLAGALKDNKRAVVVGAENTFGKGLIQTVVDLSDGAGLAVTVARWAICVCALAHVCVCVCVCGCVAVCACVHPHVIMRVCLRGRGA